MNLPIQYALLLAFGFVAVIIAAGFFSGYLYTSNKYANQIKEITDNSNQIINNFKDSKPTLEIDQRIKCTRELLTLIDDTVALELINNKRYEIFLNTNVNNRDIDKDIEEIARSVFNSLRPEIFSDKNLVMTDEYLMKYIQKRTFVAVFTYVDKNVTDKLNTITQA
mgnify:FL=1